MQVGSVVQNCGTDSDSDGASQIAHHVEEPTGVFEPIRRQAAQTEMHGWSHCKHLRETTQDLRQKKLCATPVMSDEAEAPQGETEECKAEHHEPAGIEFSRQQDVCGNTGQ